MNPNQKEAVLSVTGPVITLAGPGSGKTTVIINRLRHMLADCSIKPDRILVITYTKAAAVEMRTRFVTGEGLTSRVNFGTFHSIFFQILKKHYGYTGANILSREQGVRILLSLLSGSDMLGGSAELIFGLLDEIALFKGLENKSGFNSALISSERFLELVSSYNNALSELGLVDFEDMLRKTEELLSSNNDALAFWQNKFRYILIDEFQDINPVQYRIIKLLAAPENNLFVVGDDDQSIYAFRGSAPSIMKEFIRDFPNAKEIVLDINYRSSSEILSAAASVIAHNKNRYSKNLKAEKGESGVPVSVRSFKTSDAEYDDIACEIEREIKAGKDPREIAVLFRTNDEAGQICSRLLDKDIPFSAKTGIPSIFDNRYVEPLLAYIYFLAGDDSRSNFLRFMNKPVRYIERASLREETVELSELKEYYESRDKWYVVKNITALESDLKTLSILDCAAAIHYIRNVMGYDEYLKDNLGLSPDIFEDVLDEFESLALPHKSFVSFLGYISDQRSKLLEAQKMTPASAVSILTFHGCKGLEFEVVFIPDCMDGLTPHKKSRTADELEEERRMFYVAMTRAKDKLFLSSSLKRFGKEQKLSRFIGELHDSISLPKKGSRIYHLSYKEGTVITVDGDRLTVKFDELLVPKKLSFSFCTEKGLIRVL